MTLTLENILKEAVKRAISAAIADEVRETVASETRRALTRIREELTLTIRAAVAAVINEALDGRAIRILPPA